jgi:hypothetical protein
VPKIAAKNNCATTAPNGFRKARYQGRRQLSAHEIVRRKAHRQNGHVTIALKQDRFV